MTILHCSIYLALNIREKLFFFALWTAPYWRNVNIYCVNVCVTRSYNNAANLCGSGSPCIHRSTVKYRPAKLMRFMLKCFLFLMVTAYIVTKRLKESYSLDSWYCRRIESDLIMCYRIINNLVRIDVDLFFKRSVVCNTRGNSMKLNKCHIISSRDGRFFR